MDELPPRAREELLAWCDTARVGDAKKSVTTDFAKNHAYDYTFEGGVYLSQQNPNHPQSRPREVQVIYVGAVEKDTNW